MDLEARIDLPDSRRVVEALVDYDILAFEVDSAAAAVVVAADDVDEFAVVAEQETAAWLLQLRSSQCSSIVAPNKIHLRTSPPIP